MSLEQLGPYRIQRQIGQGGMGTVYAAVNEQTGEPAAVKVLSTLLGSHENFRARFEAEVETLKRLKHPSIVQMVGYGEQEGHLFYAMELIDGTSLHDELKKGRRFTWQEVIKFGIAISAALKLAHDSGVIHRDLKPANLMLTCDGHIKLMDFGIARLFGASQLTADGGVVGTIDYMAPEQAEAQPVTARSDLYSLGAVFYALLTGRPPFIGKSLPQIIHALRYDAPIPVHRMAPDTPDELSLVVDQLLEKDPKKRIPTALILGNRLKAIEHGLTKLAAQLEADAASGQTRTSDEYRLADDPPGPGGVPAGPTRTIPGKDLATRVSQTSGASGAAGNARGDATAVPLTVASSAPPSEQGPAVSWGDLTQVTPGRSNAPRPDLPGPNTRNQPTLADEPSRSAVSKSHFTTIDEDERRRVRQQREEFAEGRRLAWLRVTIVIVAAVLLSFSLWWLTRPPSADALYARVAEVAATSDLDRLEAIETDLDSFLEHYSSDPRGDEVRDWKEQVVAYRETRKLARRSKSTQQQAALAPCERLVAEATHLATTDPETALARLRSLVDLFDESDEADESTTRALDLARQQIPRIEALADRQRADDLALIKRRLDWADQRRESDADSARRVYASVVALFADKPWAAELVARAKSRLSPESTK